MAETHIVLDVGPGVLVAVAALFSFLTSSLSMYYGFKNGRKIDQANSHLALALQQASNSSGKSTLTITPIVPNQV